MAIDRGRLHSIVAAAALVGCLGCSGTNHTPPPAADPAAARAALEKALGCWQMRITPAQLQESEPAITVADEDWSEGRRLLEYQLLADEQAWGTSIRWPVRLKLVLSDGREQSLDVLYVISTNPIIHISRRD
ncbi:MAG: hypothetical protein WD872_09490 [Pirellulaceae bacterium]